MATAVTLIMASAFYSTSKPKNIVPDLHALSVNQRDADTKQQQQSN